MDNGKNMKLLYGKPVADEILTRLKADIAGHEEKPGLAVILIGEDKASQLYVNLKEKAAKQIGVEFCKYLIPEITAESDVLKLVDLLNQDENIQGIIVQLPLPAGFDTEKIIRSIDSQKDADGFHPENAKQFLQGAGKVWPVFPSAILRLIESSREELAGKKAVIAANSEEFGEMMQEALRRSGISAGYVLAKAVPSNLGQIQAADIVVSAVGAPGLLKGGMFKEGAIIIDGGIKQVGKKIVGDVDFASTEGKDGFLTPVPGGVGPVTIACLLENVYSAFVAQQKE